MANVQPRSDLKSRLRALRHTKGWTQQELGTYLGVRQPIISDWERGKAIPKPSLLARLAALYAVPEEDFYSTLSSPAVLDAPVHPPLTTREVSALLLLANGLSTKAIAQEMGVRAKSVKNTFWQINRKLHTTNRVQALITALQLGVIEISIEHDLSRTIIK